MDLGGVLLDWDRRYLYRKIFNDAGRDNSGRMDWFLTHVCSLEWNMTQDEGRPWSVAEAELVAHYPDFEPEIRAYRARWHEMISGPIMGTVAILDDLAARDVPIYSITNFASDTYRETSARFSFFQHFRGVVVSGDEGLLKPDPRIYRLLEARYGIDLTDCVFVDDVPANCNGARDCGMHAIEFTSPDQARNCLRELGLLA
jgi:HAD superfamily hydrolase (TIGR01509 family)